MPSPERSTPAGPLVGLRVVELGGSIEVHAVGALLADYGADVVVVEEPGAGHPGRHDPLWWRSAARNKRSVARSLDQADQRAAVLQLIEAADVVIDDGHELAIAAWGVRYERARVRNPGLVSVRVTPYGTTGPMAGRPGSAVTAEAFAGLAHITGDADKAPLPSDFAVGTSVTGLFGALSALAAVTERSRVSAGLGRHIDLASSEAIARILEFLPVYHDQLGWVLDRTGSESDYQVPVNRWPTSDGVWMSFTGNTEDIVHRFFRAMDRADLSEDERFATNAGRVEHRQELDDLIRAWFAEHTWADVDVRMEEAKVPIAAILSMAEVFEEEHYRQRGTLVTVEDAELGTVRIPSFAGRFSRTSPSIRHLGPALDADGEAVLAEWSAPRPTPPSRPTPAGGGVGTGPLAGLRVLDLGNVIAGPLTTTLLGDLGADVVKVERKGTGDLFRNQSPKKDGESVWWKVEGRGKRSIALDLKDEADRQVLLDLARQADVVVENFVAGVADNLGIGWADLHEVNPRLVMVSISGYGSKGPLSVRRAFGRNAEAFSGMAYITGYPGERPQHTGFPVADSFTALFGALGALASLYERDVTGSGEGQWIDLALYESVFRFMEPQALLFDTTGQVWQRGDARHRPERWRAVVATADGRWAVLAAADATTVASVAELVGCSVADVLADEAAVAAWAARLTLAEVEGAALSRGIPAVGALDTAEVLADPHVAARGLMVRIGPPGAEVLMPAVVPRFDGQRPAIRRPAPALGGDRDEILADWLGGARDEGAGEDGAGEDGPGDEEGLP